MALLLTQVPGFSDLPNYALLPGSPAFGYHVGAIASNAEFGMVSTEFFQGFFKDGDTIPLPISEFDGYNYDRDELLYYWATQTTYNPDTGDPSGPDALWYAAWKVDQNTGEVFTNEFYRTSDPAEPKANGTKDGVLQVFAIGIRRRTSLTLSAIPVFSDVADAKLATDVGWRTDIIKQLNANAKFSLVSSEVMYMGEFTTGQTIPQPISSADGKVYAYADVKFMYCWRWTCLGSSFSQPNIGYGQLGPMTAAINAATGVVTLTVKYIDAAGALNTIANHGRVAVFAFCRRSPGALALASGFVEQLLTQFFPPSKLRADALTILNNNIRESVQTPEWFGPTSNAHASTLSLPVGADGYTYSRAELHYLWDWEDTTSNVGSNLRVSGWFGKIAPTTGSVSLTVLRLQPGGPFVEEHTNGNIRIRVLVAAFRERTPTNPSPALSGTVSGDLTSGGAGTAGVAVDPAHAGIFAPMIYTGFGRLLDANEIVGVFTVPGNGTVSVSWPVGLTGSYLFSWGAAAASTVFTFKKLIAGVLTTVGTATFALGATSATFSFVAGLTLLPGERFTVVAPAVPDTTLTGLHGIIAATRT